MNLKQFDKIRNKIKELEEINFIPEEYHHIFQMAGMDLLNNSEMRTLILAFCEKLNPELSEREYKKIKSYHPDLPD
ncbi:hypothetical protein [uncultured Mediterranean phage uvDeep-CGR2-AD10-C281]|jgi:hypothetical protein|nr:hypothetical protein [uncultured Mediterranean phage uvDeep-CGR2-AD10-C281]